MSSNLNLAATLRQAVFASSADDVVAQYVLERLPYLFGDDWALYRTWRRKVGANLDIDPCNIAVVGSAGVGVSLSPSKIDAGRSLRPFGDTSDIDIAVVSDFHFAVAWRALRKSRLADARTSIERASLRLHKENYIYWGCIATDKILRLLPFARDWTRALLNIRDIAPTAGREVNIRIYRDYDALRSYHIQGVESLRAALEAQ